MLWCTTWKGTPQDCVDHTRQKHSVPLLWRLTWHTGFYHGQSPERYDARPWSRMSPVCRLTFSYSVTVVRHCCTIIGFSAVMQHSAPSWKVYGWTSELHRTRRGPKADGGLIAYRAVKSIYWRHLIRILFAAFDRGIRRMNPRSARPPGGIPGHTGPVRWTAICSASVSGASRDSLPSDITESSRALPFMFTSFLVTCVEPGVGDFSLALAMLEGWRLHGLWRPEFIHTVFCHIVCNISLCFRRKVILCFYYIYPIVSVCAFVEKQVAYSLLWETRVCILSGNSPFFGNTEHAEPQAGWSVYCIQVL